MCAETAVRSFGKAIRALLPSSSHALFVPLTLFDCWERGGYDSALLSSQYEKDKKATRGLKWTDTDAMHIPTVSSRLQNYLFTRLFLQGHFIVFSYPEVNFSSYLTAAMLIRFLHIPSPPPPPSPSPVLSPGVFSSGACLVVVSILPIERFHQNNGVQSAQI